MKLSLPSLYEVIKTTINNPLFLEKHRLLKNAFTRNRLLNFPTLILYLLNLRKHSNQVELDQFFKAINEEKIASQVITKSAFFQSRKQVSYTAQARHATSRNSGTPVTLIRSPTQRMGYALNALRP